MSLGLRLRPLPRRTLNRQEETNACRQLVRLNRRTFLKPRTPKTKNPRLQAPKIRVMKSPCRANITANRLKYSPIAVKSREKTAYPSLWRLLSDSPFLNHAVWKEPDSVQR